MTFEARARPKPILVMELVGGVSLDVTRRPTIARLRAGVASLAESLRDTPWPMPV